MIGCVWSVLKSDKPRPGDRQPSTYISTWSWRRNGVVSRCTLLNWTLDLLDCTPVKHGCWREEECEETTAVSIFPRVQMLQLSYSPGGWSWTSSDSSWVNMSITLTHTPLNRLKLRRTQSRSDSTPTDSLFCSDVIFLLNLFFFFLVFWVSWVSFQLLSLQCFMLNAINVNVLYTEMSHTRSGVILHGRFVVMLSNGLHCSPYTRRHSTRRRSPLRLLTPSPFPAFCNKALHFYRHLREEGINKTHDLSF